MHIELPQARCESVAHMAPGAVHYGPPRIAGPALLLFAAVLGVTSLGSDAPGRLLIGVAVAGALGAALWTLGGPALSADLDAVRIRRVVGRHQLPWSAVRSVQADSRRRSRAVEIATDEALFAVPAVLLGRASPGEVVTALSELLARSRSRQTTPEPGD